jgi:hypothetical protein
MPLPLVPLIAAGAGLAGSGINAYSQGRQNKKTIKANKEMAQFAYKKDLEMWQRNNEYNRPEAQMERLRQAGLNPNLVYGNGSVVGNTSGQMPKYNAPRIDYNHQPFDPTPAIGNFIDAQLKEAQIDNLKANAQNVEARTASELIKRSGYLTDNQKKQLELGVASKLEETTVEMGKKQLEMMRQRISTEEVNRIGKTLKNEWQTYRNRWEKFGVTAKDALMIRAGAQLLGVLGANTQWMFDMFKDVVGIDINEILKGIKF